MARDGDALHLEVADFEKSEEDLEWDRREKKSRANCARQVIACGHAVAELRSSMVRQPSCLSKRFYGGKGEAKALASEKKVGSWP